VDRARLRSGEIRGSLDHWASAPPVRRVSPDPDREGRVEAGEDRARREARRPDRGEGAQAPHRRAAKKIAACKFGAVSIRLAPAKGGWRGSLVIVGAAQGIDDKPIGTAKFRLRGKRVLAANALAKKIARSCR